MAISPFSAVTLRLAIEMPQLHHGFFPWKITIKNGGFVLMENHSEWKSGTLW